MGRVGTGHAGFLSFPHAPGRSSDCRCVAYDAHCLPFLPIARSVCLIFARSLSHAEVAAREHGHGCGEQRDGADG